MRDPVSWRGLADVARSLVWSRFAWPCDLGATRRRSAEFIARTGNGTAGSDATHRRSARRYPAATGLGIGWFAWKSGTGGCGARRVA